MVSLLETSVPSSSDAMRVVAGRQMSVTALLTSTVHTDSGKPYQESVQERFRIQIPKSID
jgi:hypothetical protein